MALKNYTTKVPASRSIEEIQTALVKHGAVGVLYEYETGGGKISSLKFVLPMGDKKVGFALPCEWRRFQQVLKNDRVGRAKDEEYVYRVAWRCIRDWVLSQLALYETQIVDLPQIFLPFATGKDGETLYQKVMAGGLLLGDGS